MRVSHDYSVGNLVYAENTGIYRKLYYDKQGPYRINEVFTNGTVLLQRDAINEQINIIRLVPYFDSVDTLT